MLNQLGAAIALEMVIALSQDGRSNAPLQFRAVWSGLLNFVARRGTAGKALKPGETRASERPCTTSGAQRQ